MVPVHYNHYNQNYHMQRSSEMANSFNYPQSTSFASTTSPYSEYNENPQFSGFHNQKRSAISHNNMNHKQRLNVNHALNPYQQQMTPAEIAQATAFRIYAEKHVSGLQSQVEPSKPSWTYNDCTFYDHNNFVAFKQEHELSADDLNESPVVLPANSNDLSDDLDLLPFNENFQQTEYTIFDQNFNFSAQQSQEFDQFNTSNFMTQYEYNEMRRDFAANGRETALFEDLMLEEPRLHNKPSYIELPATFAFLEENEFRAREHSSLSKPWKMIEEDVVVTSTCSCLKKQKEDEVSWWLSYHRD